MKRKNYIYGNCKVTRVVDGDTIWAEMTVSADIGFGIIISGTLTQEFRVLDFDASEIFHPKSKDEKTDGNNAAAKAEELLLGKLVTIQSYRGDKWGRYLGNITMPDGRDFATVMKELGFQKKV
jgi:endonuclease YncB( thermonuclease family)